jgi:hypothetical protein
MFCHADDLALEHGSTSETRLSAFSLSGVEFIRCRSSGAPECEAL